MRETVKTLTMGARVLALATMVICVYLSGTSMGTVHVGTAPADGVLADAWTHIDSKTWHPKGCWGMDEHALVKVPTHVYATFPNGDMETRGPVWAQKALDQVFANKKTEGLAPIAFCR